MVTAIPGIVSLFPYNKFFDPLAMILVNSLKNISDVLATIKT